MNIKSFSKLKNLDLVFFVTFAKTYLKKRFILTHILKMTEPVSQECCVFALINQGKYLNNEMH